MLQNVPRVDDVELGIGEVERLEVADERLVHVGVLPDQVLDHVDTHDMDVVGYWDIAATPSTAGVEHPQRPGAGEERVQTVLQGPKYLGLIGALRRLAAARRLFQVALGELSDLRL